MTIIQQDEAQRSFADCIAQTANGPVLLENDGRTVAALVSMDDYELVRKARQQQMEEAFDAIAKDAKAAGITEENLAEFLAE